MAKGQNKQGKNHALTIERRRHAIALRTAGAGYEEIAKQLGLSNPGTAYKIVQAALKATLREPADEVRKLELERLDRLTLALWARAKGGESEAIDRVLKLMDRRAKLLGLDTVKSDDAAGPVRVIIEHVQATGASATPEPGEDSGEREEV